MKFIVAQMKPENSIYGCAMRVIASSHGRFDIGSRFDYGFLAIAVSEGFVVTVLPDQSTDTLCTIENKKPHNSK